MNCSRCGLAIRDDGESHHDADACIAAWRGFWQATQDVLRMFCETNEELKAQNAALVAKKAALESWIDGEKLRSHRLESENDKVTAEMLRLDAEVMRLRLREIALEAENAALRADKLIYCHGCGGSVIYKKRDDGHIEFFHSCYPHGYVDALRADKERLDWREANPHNSFGLWADGMWADGKGRSHKTYRDALDAARKGGA